MANALLVLFTGALVVVGFLQWRVYQRQTSIQANAAELQRELFAFQQKLEASRVRVQVFAAIKEYMVDTPQGPRRTAALYIANLSNVSIWLGKAYLVVDGRAGMAAEAPLVEMMVAPQADYWFPIEDPIRARGLAADRTIHTVGCELHCSALDATHNFKTGLYDVDMHPEMRGVSGVRPHQE